MSKTFKIEAGDIVVNDTANVEQVVKLSVAASLKRIADALEAANKEKNRSVFEEVFGSRG